MLKAAVIGVGSMGHNHARVYSELENVKLVAIVDPNSSLAAKIGPRLGVPYYTELDKMLDECQPDLVSVAVPTSLHFEIGAHLIRRGIHLLIEKPLTFTIEEGEELVALAASHGVVLCVGHIERFNPAVTELRRRLTETTLGDIYQIHAHRLSPYPPRIKDVGVVIDLATHDIDLMRFLMQDDIVHLYGETVIGALSGHEDVFNGMMRFRKGVLGVLNVNWLTPTKTRTLTITGSRGMYLCNLLSQELVFHENGNDPGSWDSLGILHGVTEGRMIGFPIRRYEPLSAELGDFVDAVANNKRPQVTGLDGLETLRIAHAFLRSSLQGVVVRELVPSV